MGSECFDNHTGGNIHSRIQHTDRSPDRTADIDSFAVYRDGRANLHQHLEYIHACSVNCDNHRLSNDNAIDRIPQQPAMLS